MDYTVALILLPLIVILMIAGVHIAFALGITGILGMYLALDGNLYAIQMIIWDSTTGFTLVVLVYFILMGEILLAGNISSRLYEGVMPWCDRLPGSILHVNIIGSTIFAALTGLSAACAATLGRIAAVEGSKRGIPIGINLGSLAGGATLGILIPPSVILIIYGILTENSIGRLFMAGALPGLMLAMMFALYIAIRSIVRRELVPAESVRYSWRGRLHGLIALIPIFVIIFVVLGIIYFGWATPNEAGGVGAFFSFILCLIYRDFKWRDLWTAVTRTARITSMVLFLIIGAKIVTYLVANIGIPHLFAEWIVGSGFSPITVMALICLVYIILGMFIDSFSILILTLPIVYPVVANLDVDPILFGVIVVLLIETGLITPPYGINLYILDGVSGGGHLEEIIKGSIPFFIILLVGIVILMLFPDIALWLPGKML